ncbi:MAG: NeuD/PglB/VioB family sugar acetyltransferase [Deltaproteobacteria bacterium]|jgi:acetyltransferase EpsM|nr:NeuD/PglB/VioB family sugar acetyltransferase [Deltaproteobacteria bacterium]
MTIKLIILGAVGTCIDVAEAALATGKYELLGFLDDAFSVGTLTPIGLQILGNLKDINKFDNVNFINVIGGPTTFRHKPALTTGLQIENNKFISVIHPSSLISKTASIGAGSWILGHCDIGASVEIGNHVGMLQQCVVGHDSILDAFVTLSAGVKISGRVKIGFGTYIGAGSIIRQDIVIGSDCLIGAGSVVVSNIPPHSICYGVPAKVHRQWNEYNS